MSIKSKIITAAAALALIVGVGAAGTPTANAATPNCGAGCFNLFSAFSTTANPEFVLGVSGPAQLGGAVIFAPESRTNPGEDFEVSDVATVHQLFLAGLFPSGLDALYSSLNVFEIEFTPGGINSGFCVGVGSTPGFGTPVTLQPCGTTVKTFWIFDPQITLGSAPYYALINGATTNFKHPYSLTALFQGLPLITAPLLPYSFPPTLFAHQVWAPVYGVLP
jgi:hypothetical protein